MFGVVSRVAPKAKAALVQPSRKMTAIAAPPENRVSWAEKLCHGIAICTGILTVPAYVLVNIKHYKSRD